MVVDRKEVERKSSEMACSYVTPDRRQTDEWFLRWAHGTLMNHDVMTNDPPLIGSGAWTEGCSTPVIVLVPLVQVPRSLLGGLRHLSTVDFTMYNITKQHLNHHGPADRSELWIREPH